MTIYYVDGTNGLESNDGLTEETPKLYLSSSIGVVAGDICKIKCGTIAMLTSNILPADTWTLESYGTGSKPIIRVAVDSNSNPRIEHTGSGTFTVRNLEFENCGVPGQGTAIFATGTATCIIENNKIHSPFFNGMKLGRGANHRVRYNDIAQVTNNGIIVGVTGFTSPSNGIYEFNKVDATNAENDALTLHDGGSGGTGNIIRFNYLIGGVEQCIDIVGTYLNTTIYKNVCIRSKNSVESWGAIDLNNTGRVIGNIVDCRIGGGAGIKVRNVAAGGVLVAGNTVQCGITTSNAQGIYVINSANTLVYNNTLISNNQSSRATLATSGSNGIVLKNNLFIHGNCNQNLVFFQTTTPGEINNNFYVLDNTAATRWNSATFASWQATFTADAAGQALAAIDLTRDYGPIDENSILVEAGQFVGYLKDQTGKQFWNPPCVGARELDRARLVRN